MSVNRPRRRLTAARLRLLACIPAVAMFVYALAYSVNSAAGGYWIYPIMDGFYCSSPDRNSMEQFRKVVFSKLAKKFVEEEKDRFRFIIKGAIAKGNVYHGCNLDDEAAHTLADNKNYRSQIMLGMPMIQAHLGQDNAPPFGLFVDSSAQALVLIMRNILSTCGGSGIQMKMQK